MKKKLTDAGGLTLVEMLCAVVILILLGLLLNTGIQMAVRSYRDMVAQSEVELLLSTAIDALSDDLRYAQDVKYLSGDTSRFIYRSDSFGPNTQLKLENNQITANGKRVLPSGAYGPDGAYQITKMEISPTIPADKGAEITFAIELTVSTADGRITAGTPDGGVTVRCLNRNK